jgi:hypothetical protein
VNNPRPGSISRCFFNTVANRMLEIGGRREVVGVVVVVGYGRKRSRRSR